MKSQGFTLIELVMLITVLLILSVTAWVRMPSVNFFQSYSFSNILLYDLNLTKTLSMSLNQRYRLIIGSSSYQIQDQNGVALLNPETNSSVVSYPTGVTITPTTTIVFDSLGQPYNAVGTTALTTTLTLTVSASGTTQTISVSPQTGFIQ
ncbi:MAG: hypothetical protein Q8R24_02880 [Legionellaceae bacterium]|nr:hypothetical protein [Legionellaceae bacterium]